MPDFALIHETEVTACGECGHLAVDHHGIDPSPIYGGCFATGSGHPWSARKKCPCPRTCTEALAGG